MRVGLGEEQSARRAILNLNDELEEDMEALGQSIFTALKAKSAKETVSPILKGKIFATRKSIVDKQICQVFNSQISPLSSRTIITNASGNS